MSFFDPIKRIIAALNGEVITSSNTDLEMFYSSFDFARSVGFDLIANIISKCEFITYEENAPVKKAEYYKFNFEPCNKYNAPKFWYEVVFKMLNEKSTLVIEHNRQLCICDSFYYDEENDRFTQIVINNKQTTIIKKRKEAFYFILANDKLYNDLELVKQTYTDMFMQSANTYKRKNRAKIFVPTTGNIGKNSSNDEKLDEVNKQFKRMLDNRDSMISAPAERKPFDLSPDSYSFSDSEKINNEILQLVALSLHIPINVFLGNSTWTREQLNDFITFIIDPILNMMSCEINRIYYKWEKVSLGTYVLIDKTRIRHHDILEKAAAIDQLFRVGFSHNDILTILNKPKINEEWANIHYVTKNYSDILSLDKEVN